MKLLLEKWDRFLNEAVPAYEIEHQKIIAAVDRALQLLELSSNKNLRQFLIEIAITESAGNPDGIPGKMTHHTKNPFQITDGAIRTLAYRGAKKLDILRNRIRTNGGIKSPWYMQTPQEIKGTPSMGALAAALLIIHKMNPRGNDELTKPALNATIPSSMPARAALWKRIYNTGADPHGTPTLYIKRNSLQ
tara:strand:- start:9260 stop:9832 length:573 start_codon:yes stop_codon:yes gene_type:complete